MTAVDGDIVDGFTSPEALLEEERGLVVENLDEWTCYAMGCWIADRALPVGQPLAISIRLVTEGVTEGDTDEVFRLKLPGSPAISGVVLDAKYRTGHRGQHSSLYERNLRLARATTFEAETGLSFPEYAPFGGAVPIRTGLSGRIGAWVIVTGLTQEDDHAVAVDAIRTVSQRASTARRGE